jgi:hypothetical protein
VRFVDFGFLHVDAAVPARGFDLDCDHLGAQSCVTHGDDSIANTELLGGTDNGVGALVGDIATLLTDEAGSDFNLNQHIESGEIGLLVQVGGYNGGANDANVGTVFVIASAGIYPSDAAGPVPPAWDGGDTWTVEQGSADTAGLPRFKSTSAYVRDNVLVAFFDVIHAPASIGPGTGIFELEHAVLTARVVHDPFGYHLDDGQIGARIRTSTVLSSLAQFRDPFVPDSGSMCGSDPTYASAKSTYICPGADINADPLHDNAGRGCNAFSVAIGFRAFPARISDIRARSVEAGCASPDGASWFDDCPSDNGEY